MIRPCARITETRVRTSAALFACVCTLAGPAPLRAQELIAGIAVDEQSGGALPCNDVPLVRNDGVIHATAFEPGHRDHQPVCDLVLQRFSFKVLKP